MTVTLSAAKESVSFYRAAGLTSMLKPQADSFA